MDYDRRDRIFIRDLLIRGILGINDEERVNEQDILVNLTLFTDIREAAETEDIGRTVNYKSLKKKVITHVETSRRLLVERLAEDIAGLCLEESRVRAVKVRVEKPTALRFARSVGVEILRERESGEPPR